MQPAEMQDPVAMLKTGMTYEEGYVAPRLVPYSRHWFVAKVVLRCVSLGFCLTLFGLAIASSSLTWDYSPWGYDRAWIPSVPVAVLAALYDIAAFVVLCVRRNKKRGIHPAVDVTADLCIWLAALAGGILTPFVAYRGNYYHDPYDEDIAVTVFLFFLALVHIILMSRACRETEQRNKSRSDVPKLYYIPGGGQPFSVQLEPTDNSPPEALLPIAAPAFPPPIFTHDPEAEEVDVAMTGSQKSGQKEIIPDGVFNYERR